MLLIDALYINNGGGKILLDLLIKVVSQRGLAIMYLLDQRIADDYRSKNLPNVTFMEASLVRRHLYYLEKKNDITSVLAFGNIPPTVKLKCKVFTYFHNVLFLESGRPASSSNSMQIKLKSLFIQFISRNTYKWVVQTRFVKDRLAGAWGISPDDILILPIYDDKVDSKPKRVPVEYNEKIKFIYVSNGHFYKNHKLLIEAFSVYNKLYTGSSLVLTIGEEYPELKSIIKEATDIGINIIDKGIISLEELNAEYENADVCIYPSLFESFGLGLIEAALKGMPICASDLPFVYEVVKPNSIFDPNSKESIFKSLLAANTFGNVHAELICENKLEELIDTIDV
jgi:glycosyltransferase involved in cell wall biosynthesis